MPRTWTAVDSSDYWCNQYRLVSKQLVECQAELSKVKDEAYGFCEDSGADYYERGWRAGAKRVKELEAELAEAKQPGDAFWQHAIEGREEVIGKLDAENKRLEVRNSELIRGNAELVDRRKAVEADYKQLYFDNEAAKQDNIMLANWVAEVKDENDTLRKAFNEQVASRKRQTALADSSQRDAAMWQAAYWDLADALTKAKLEAQAQHERDVTKRDEESYRNDELRGEIRRLEGELELWRCDCFDPVVGCTKELPKQEPTKPALKPVPDDCNTESKRHEYCVPCIRRDGQCHYCGGIFAQNLYDVEGYGKDWFTPV